MHMWIRMKLLESPRRATLLDRTGLLIVGVGASIFYFYLERALQGSHFTLVLTVTVILLISCCTQLLVNKINSRYGAGILAGAITS